MEDIFGTVRLRRIRSSLATSLDALDIDDKAIQNAIRVGFKWECELCPMSFACMHPFNRFSLLLHVAENEQ